MGRYFYPEAHDALSAKKQFLRDYHYFIDHCYKNTFGKGYVLFDTKDDINKWWKENTGYVLYKDDVKQTYTRSEAFTLVRQRYGNSIDEILASRDHSLPFLAVGLPPTTAFGNRLFLKFVSSSNEEDIERRFYIHYNARIFSIDGMSNDNIREKLVEFLYNYFAKEKFFKR